MTTWTLSFDESGRFEGCVVDGERDERYWLVLGGLLCRGDAETLEKKWRDPLKRECREYGIAYPPHAVGLSPNKREIFYRSVGRLLQGEDARWIFIVGRAAGDVHGSLSVYVRMLADIVDLAARVASRAGATKLDVRPAQRSVPVVPEVVARARKLGLGVRENEEGKARIRPLAEVESRQALDALTRESSGDLNPWPSLSSIDVVSANDGRVHPGIVLADLACYLVYSSLRDRPDVSLREVLGDLWVNTRAYPVLIERERAGHIRRIDRALRERPAQLHEAARAVAELEGNAAKSAEGSGMLRAAEESCALLGRELWNGAVRDLGEKQNVRHEAIALLLGGRADAHLAIKGGHYEGTWRALWEGWAGDTKLAQRAREALNDRESAAKLWRVTMECANHRGDVDRAQQARKQCEVLFRRGMSMALLAERLRVLNLSLVAHHNCLPASPESLDVILRELQQESLALEKVANEAGEVLALATSEMPFDEVIRREDPSETRLWQSLVGKAPEWQRPDQERGRIYGTIARSWAFLGQLDRAIELALRARSFFADSEFDLRFNATVIARMEIERARVHGVVREAPLEAALLLAGADAMIRPRDAVESVAKQPASRFVLDLVLRAMVWGATPWKVRLGEWHEALARWDEKSIFGILSSGELRSHPTELIARHAGEVLAAGGQAESAKRWFDLSIALSEAAPAGSTIARFAEFTRRLAKDPSFKGEGAAGCVTNPNFEYR